MTNNVSGFVDIIFWITAVGFVVVLGLAVAITVVVIRTFRRAASAANDRAEEELRGRLARGEIDMAEFQVRLRGLKRGEDA
jgi:uncharacterized membrane protein